MKTAVSLPDEVFAEAEHYARKAGKTRSQLYGEALREYLLHHSPDAVTKAMNDACADLDQQEDGFLQTAARRILKRETW